MKNVAFALSVLFLIPASVFGAVIGPQCDSVEYSEQGENLTVVVSLEKLGLDGSASITIAKELGDAAIDIQVEDDGSMLTSRVPAALSAEVLHVQQLAHKDGELALLPVIEIYFEKNFFAIQLRDFLTQERYVVVATMTAPGMFVIDCPQLEWSPLDFESTKKMNLNMNGAIAGFLAFKREETKTLNIEKAHLELDVEELEDKIASQDEHLRVLQGSLSQREQQLFSLNQEVQSCEATKQEISGTLAKGKRKLKKLKKQGSTAPLGMLGKLVRKISRLMD